MLVLIADDDVDDLSFFCEAMSLVDGTTRYIQVSNGEEALSYLVPGATELPDIIFLDVNMPRMDGYETLQAIRRNPLLSSIPVAMWSTSTSPSDIEFFKKNSALYFSKPSSVAQLKTTLTEALKLLLT